VSNHGAFFVCNSPGHPLKPFVSKVNPHEVVSSFNQLIKEAAREEAAQERE